MQLQWTQSSHFWGFEITLRHSTFSRTPLNERSARRRDLYLTTHNTHTRQTIVPPVGFEPLNPSTQAATVIGLYLYGWMYWQGNNTHEQQLLRIAVQPVITVASRDVTRVLSFLHEFVTQWHNSIKCLRLLGGMNIDLNSSGYPLITRADILYTQLKKKSGAKWIPYFPAEKVCAR